MKSFFNSQNIGILIKNVAKVIEYGSYMNIIINTGYTAYIKYRAMVKGDPDAFDKMSRIVAIEQRTNDVATAIRHAQQPVWSRNR